MSPRVEEGSETEKVDSVCPKGFVSYKAGRGNKQVGESLR